MSATPTPWWELVDPELVEQFVALVHDTRMAQRLYRRTISPTLKHELPKLEEQVDAVTERIRAAIAAARPAELVEGGVA
ncbi:MAG TPA: hypothetical protein VH092_39105 [Urbifossiella sp.]|jgi:hypothetical protein|nr:hypothetical protein [Urbifossiella sp.]